ncbi:MAG: hypothetical protein GXP54_02440 [Deltaproteobacteria bacterium]|nr:hypothetical protein [Deltaproteobacteria bacterium]
MKTLAVLTLGFTIVVPAFGAEHIHPAFALKDWAGNTVFDEAAGVSDMTTCGQCHDTAYIQAHNTHKEHGQDVSCFQCHLKGGLEGLEPEDFNGQGLLKKPMTPPDCNTCGQCHGMVHQDKKFLEIGPEILEGKEVGPFGRTLQTGEIFSPQIITFSHIDLKDKYKLDYPWDIHAERGVHCTACHFPANDPARPDLTTRKGPKHLKRDPRTLDLGSYLKKPDHRFAAAQCEACHDTVKAHPNLPYPRRHMEALSCQACHVPTLRGPALESTDRTVVTSKNGPRMTFRGVDVGHGPDYPNTWFYKGYSPALLHEGGKDRFAPFNLVTTWQWIEGDSGEPVPFETVRKAFKGEDGEYLPGLKALFDKNHDGRIDSSELVLDSRDKTDAIRTRLESLGVKSPRIVGTVGSHPIRHGVVAGKWVENDCRTCHGVESRFNEAIPLASGPFPGGVSPTLDKKTKALIAGRRLEDRGGGLVLGGNEEPEGHYVLGHSRRPWSDWFGFWVFVLSVLGVAVHGTMRMLSRRKHAQAPGGTLEKVYMYGVYERIWHWTMALGIIMLLLTGFQIHYSQGFALMAFPTAVFVHNFFAVVLLINAFLGMFFHLATGEIRQFIPEGAGLLRRLWIQAVFYGKGIFAGASHPFLKTRMHKLNPLQQFTYVGLLNVLFPFQVVTGLLLWLAGLMPEDTVAFGGLSVVAPLHNLGSWMFLSFLVVHVYLTTTGHTITSNIKAMFTGWDISEDEPHETSRGEAS